jgi:hypothetical protein
VGGIGEQGELTSIHSRAGGFRERLFVASGAKVGRDRMERDRWESSELVVGVEQREVSGELVHVEESECVQLDGGEGRGRRRRSELLGI